MVKRATDRDTVNGIGLRGIVATSPIYIGSIERIPRGCTFDCLPRNKRENSARGYDK